MRWLHLSDLHIGLGLHAQELALDSLFDYLDQQLQRVPPIDAVFVTGDLTQAGTTPQFQDFNSAVLNQMKSLSTLKSALCFVAPGNHDLNCESTLPTPWDSLGVKRQQVFFDSTPEGAKTRQPRTQGFQEFAAFVEHSGCIALDPIRVVAEAHLIKPLDTNIITLNTALFSDRHTDDYQQYPAPIPALREALRKVNPSHPTIVLAHHPIDWFTPPTQRTLSSLLHSNAALYLHGHTHEVNVVIAHRGVLALGFGAAYPKSLDAPGDPSYTNSFAICDLADTLEVAVHSWNTTQGHWQPSPNLSPVHFVEPSLRIPNGYTLNIPKPDNKRRVKPTVTIRGPRQIPPALDRAFWSRDSTPASWIRFLSDAQILPDVTDLLGVIFIDETRVEFVAQTSSGRVLCIAISAPGHILSYDDVEAANTRIDTEDTRGCIIVTFGKVSPEAHALAERLSSRKKFELLHPTAFGRHIEKVLSVAIRQHIKELDSSEVEITAIVKNQGVSLAVVDKIKKSWFYILKPDGSLHLEADVEVQSVRMSDPLLTRANYGYSHSAGKSNLTLPAVQFDKARYLQETQVRFDNVRYAGLSAFGLRASDASLSDIYIPGTGVLSTVDKSTESVMRAVTEYAESLGLDDASRTLLERALSQRHGVQSTSDRSVARKLYQQHGCVLLLGDPGSGKTCFVKNEILAYSKRPPAAWYESHVPVYVELAELSARIADIDASADNPQFIDLVSSTLGRSGLFLPPDTLYAQSKNGSVAYFFDGLDEVSSYEHRTQIIAAISSLIGEFLSRGCRFILTSRPAAIRGLQLHSSWRTVRLQGLNNSDIRLLATRVLSLSFNRSLVGDLPLEGKSIVSQIMRDCENIPGIRRLARNPLLLTLLVTVYSNAGVSVSAKRHRIYAQAVQTLVTVRHRDAEKDLPSESDLRRRLGELAVRILMREIGELPTRAEVVAVLSKVIQADFPDLAEPGPRISKFLEDTARATGLIILNQRSGDNVNDDFTVAFMHHSFLEYYAALASMDKAEVFDGIHEYVQTPQWREVIILLAGLLSDTTDKVSPFIERISKSPNKRSGVLREELLFALDCAIECDVPPERTIQYLLRQIDVEVAAGIAGRNHEYRREVADRLARLIQASSRGAIWAALERGILSDVPHVAAAYIDLLAHVTRVVPPPESITRSLNQGAQREDVIIRMAHCDAVQKSSALRSPEVFACISECMDASVPLKVAACAAAEQIPAIASLSYDKLLLLLDDSFSSVSASAARALLGSGIPVVDNRDLIIRRCATLWYDGDDTSISTYRGYEYENIFSKFASPDPSERDTALRLAPWLEADNEKLRETLLRLTFDDDTERSERVLALRALRKCERVVESLSFGDCAQLADLLKSAKTRDVRIETIRLLGATAYPVAAAEWISAHIDQWPKGNVSPEEAQVGLEMFASLVSNDRTKVGSLVDLLNSYIPEVGERFGSSERQDATRVALAILEDIDVEVRTSMSGRVRALAEGHRVPDHIKFQAMRTYGKVCQAGSYSISFFTDRMQGNDGRVHRAVSIGAYHLVNSLRGNYHFVKEHGLLLAELEGRLVDLWWRRIRGSDSVDDIVLRYIRLTLLELSYLETTAKNLGQLAT